MGMTKEKRKKALHTGSEIEQHMIVDCQRIADVARELERWLTTDTPTVARIDSAIDEMYSRLGVLRFHAAQKELAAWLRHKRRKARGNKQIEN